MKLLPVVTEGVTFCEKFMVGLNAPLAMIRPEVVALASPRLKWVKVPVEVVATCGKVMAAPGEPWPTEVEQTNPAVVRGTDTLA